MPTSRIVAVVALILAILSVFISQYPLLVIAVILLALAFLI